jgi:hypothetical protein
MAVVVIGPAGWMPAGGHCTNRVVFVAWLYTGPLGHLVAGVADWIALLVRAGADRVSKES